MHVPLKFGDIRRWVEKIALSVNLMTEGKTENTGTVTLTQSDTTTTVTDSRVGKDTGIYLSPTTASAATATGNTYVSAKTPGTSFVLTHANTADADKTFTYILVG